MTTTRSTTSAHPLRALAVPGRRPPVGATVRAMDADGLAVGILARYGDCTDPYPGVPYVRPLDGGPQWQAVAEYLRPATAEEIIRARAEAAS
ncbi:hypothetical protein ACIRPT_24670 [Streptomyces sp. NPDC101227]|uniref:hypothetical protein n=1 Tax=Streptomyces sp. NPDC101227 TaxID=3366136 RepID=UPI00380E55AC